MPIALPVKTIAWNTTLQARIAWSSLNQVAGDVMYQIANNLITTRGFTCKGSSTGAAAGMDGVFRWASGNDAKTRNNGAAGAMSWVAITLAGGGGDMVFSYNAANDHTYNVWWSPGGLAVAAGTATHEPTATDQVLLNKFYTSAAPGSTIINDTAAGDRLVSVWARPDKKGFRASIAANNAWASHFGCEPYSPDVLGAGVTFNPNVAWYLIGTFSVGLLGATLMSNQDVAAAASTLEQFRTMVRRTNGGGTTIASARKCLFKGKSGDSQQPASFDPDLINFSELQGATQVGAKKLGLYSPIAGHRGDIGWLIDWYLGRGALTAGETAGALDWIYVSDTMWWPWDGATAVVMS